MLGDMLYVRCVAMTDSRVAAVAQQTGLSEAQAANILRGQHDIFPTPR